MNKSEAIEYRTITKSYTHSLFTPLLCYIIRYLNENGEKPGIIGKSKIKELNIIYTILNKNIYDLFFRKTKGKIFEGKSEINYGIKNDEENYYLSTIKKESEKDYEQEFTYEDLKQIVMFDEAKLGDNESLTTFFELKKKEIISSFRLGYAMQERIINMLLAKSDNAFYELPNLIFYGKNNSRRLYSEVDRILSTKKEIKIPNFLVYLKAEFRMKSTTLFNLENFPKGEILVLQDNSCNFIEIKTSMNYLIKEKKDNIYTKLRIKNPSNTSSTNSQNDEQSRDDKMYKNMNAFITLFHSFNKHFAHINLVVIVDSYFPKDFINLAKIFVQNFTNKINFDFDLMFVHIEPDIIYTYELDHFESINNNLINKEKEIMNLKKDSQNKEENIKLLQKEINKLQNDSKTKEKEINKLQNDSKTKEKEIDKLNGQISNLKNKFDDLIKQNKLSKFKKKIRKKDYTNYFEKEVNKLNEQITKSKENNIIVGKYKNEAFKNIEKFKYKNKAFNIILDFKTFIRIFYSEEAFDLIDEIKIKHFNNLKIYSENNINSLILLVDFVFIFYIKELMGQFFKQKDLIIEPVVNELFILSFQNGSNSLNKSSFIFKDNILGYNEINLNEIPNIKNFINYYFEIKGKKDLIQSKNFPLYNPLTDKNDFLLSIITTKVKNNDILVFIVNPFIEYEQLNLDAHITLYNHIILLFQSYFFEYDDTIIKNICRYLFNGKTGLILYLNKDDELQPIY